MSSSSSSSHCPSSPPSTSEGTLAVTPIGSLPELQFTKIEIVNRAVDFRPLEPYSDVNPFNLRGPRHTFYLLTTEGGVDYVLGATRENDILKPYLKPFGCSPEDVFKSGSGKLDRRDVRFSVSEPLLDSTTVAEPVDPKKIRAFVEKIHEYAIQVNEMQVNYELPELVSALLRDSLDEADGANAFNSNMFVFSAGVFAELEPEAVQGAMRANSEGGLHPDWELSGINTNCQPNSDRTKFTCTTTAEGVFF